MCALPCRETVKQHRPFASVGTSYLFARLICVILVIQLVSDRKVHSSNAILNDEISLAIHTTHILDPDVSILRSRSSQSRTGCDLPVNERVWGRSNIFSVKRRSVLFESVRKVLIRELSTSSMPLEDASVSDPSDTRATAVRIISKLYDLSCLARSNQSLRACSCFGAEGKVARPSPQDSSCRSSRSHWNLPMKRRSRS